MNEPLLSEVLRLSARLYSDADDHRRLTDAAARLADWSLLPFVAEAHGLLPLLHLHLNQAGAAVPLDARQHLFARSIHHQRVNQIRFRALAEILSAFERADIPVLVLKGAALAHILYPSVGLRPLSDIDLLVDSHSARRAQSTLAALGFNAPGSPHTRHLLWHHHLPAALRMSEGQPVQVEIHVDALSGDTPGSLTMSRLSGPPQQFFVEGRAASALGHMDMLYHLYQHTAQPASLLRLIWVVDIVGYAMRYRDDIPWTDVRLRHPGVINALSLCHLVTPLPRELLEFVVPAHGDGLRGVGVAGKPFAGLVRSGRSAREIAHEVFDPSDWWLRLYYGLDDRASLWWCRWVTHPLHVGYWLARRVGASVGWWWSRP